MKIVERKVSSVPWSIYSRDINISTKILQAIIYFTITHLPLERWGVQLFFISYVYNLASIN